MDNRLKVEIAQLSLSDLGREECAYRKFSVGLDNIIKRLRLAKMCSPCFEATQHCPIYID